MQRRWLVALGMALIVLVGLPVASLCQENTPKESTATEPDTYEGEPVCKPARGASPRPVYQPDPQYDEKARKKKIHGTVVLSVIVTKEGATADIKVIRSVTTGLDQQAIKAVSRWRFEPGTKDGQPCPVRLTIEAQFNLY